MDDNSDERRTQRFLVYAAAFESAFASDEWTVLEPFFTEDATSELDGSVFEGRHAVLESFRNACDFFDRRFDSREMRFVEGPAMKDGAVYVKASGTYRREGLPPLELQGEEWFHFDGDRITRHVDHVLNGEEVMRYLASHSAALRPLPKR